MIDTHWYAAAPWIPCTVAPQPYTGRVWLAAYLVIHVERSTKV